MTQPQLQESERAVIEAAQFARSVVDALGAHPPSPAEWERLRERVWGHVVQLADVVEKHNAEVRGSDA